MSQTARIYRYLGQRVLGGARLTIPCPVCFLVGHHTETCGEFRLRQSPRPCIDRDCGSTTSVHAIDCAVDMSAPAMHPGPTAELADKPAGL